MKDIYRFRRKKKLLIFPTFQMNDDINRTKDNFQAITIQSSEPEMEAKPEKTGFGASH